MRRPHRSTLFPYTTLFRSQLRPGVIATGDPAGTTTWTVTLTDNTGATASRTFTVVYSPTTPLSFTSLTPNSFSSNTASSEEHTSELQSPDHNVSRLLLG